MLSEGLQQKTHETSMNELNGTSLRIEERLTLAGSPLVAFALNDDNPIVSDFLSIIKPTFSILPWDDYDCRWRRWCFIRSKVKVRCVRDVEIVEYYRSGNMSKSLSDLVGSMPDHVRREFDQIIPSRRRAVRSLVANRSIRRSWNITPTNSGPFSMETDDYRTWPRNLAPIRTCVSDHPGLPLIVGDVLDMISQVSAAIDASHVIVHQMSTVATGGASATNAPEGIHQDGADYVVPAIVISRNNVRGAVSRVFDEEVKELFSRLLLAGQGLLHPDRGSRIWHDVSTITSVDNSLPAIRNIIGFDVFLIR